MLKSNRHGVLITRFGEKNSSKAGIFSKDLILSILFAKYLEVKLLPKLCDRLYSFSDMKSFFMNICRIYMFGCNLTGLDSRVSMFKGFLGLNKKRPNYASVGALTTVDITYPPEVSSVNTRGYL